MKSLLVLCLLVVLAVAYVVGRRHRQTGGSAYRAPITYIGDHRQYNQPQPTTTTPPPPPPVTFPSDLYNQLPEDILGDALCYMLDTKYRYEALHHIYFKRWGQTEQTLMIMRQMINSNIKEGLAVVRDEALADMSPGGKEKLCSLLQHMPDSYNSCGFRNLVSFAIKTRIVGGFAAQQGAFDSYASLNIGGSANPVCGATIIDYCTILTAAHCVNDQTADHIKVNVGNHTTIASTTQLNVNSVTAHENYNTQTTANDVAILKVDPIDFNGIPNTAPACLATADYALTGQDCTAVGVGTTSYGGQQPDNYLLQQVSVPTQDGNTCDQDNSILVQMTDPNNQISAGQAGNDSCQGDSGGPLYCQQNGQQVLTGVVSYGVNCGQAGYPGVHAKVSSYADWIAARSGC